MGMVGRGRKEKGGKCEGNGMEREGSRRGEGQRRLYTGEAEIVPIT